MTMLGQLNTWSLCSDKWAELIKWLALKTHTLLQSVCRPTNVLPTTHDVPRYVSIKTQKYAHFQRFCHAISAGFSQKTTHRLKRYARQSPVTPSHWSGLGLALKMPVEGTQASAVPKAAMDLTLVGCCATPSDTCSFQSWKCRTQANTICTFHNISSWYNFRSTSSFSSQKYHWCLCILFAGGLPLIERQTWHLYIQLFSFCLHGISFNILLVIFIYTVSKKRPSFYFSNNPVKN